MADRKSAFSIVIQFSCQNVDFTTSEKCKQGKEKKRKRTRQTITKKEDITDKTSKMRIPQSYQSFLFANFFLLPVPSNCLTNSLLQTSICVMKETKENSKYCR